MRNQIENPLDDLLTDANPTAESDDGLDLQLDLGESSAPSEIAAIDATRNQELAKYIDQSFELDTESLDLGDGDRTKPLDLIPNPVTGEVFLATDVACVVRHIIELKSLKQSIETFERELRKAALHLAKGETKTRRLTAKVDGEMKTVIVEMPSENWPNRELAVLHSWCMADARVKETGQFARRFIRAKVETKYSPIKKEVKKLAAETFPDGSVLAEAKDRLLKCNHGIEGCLPALRIEGEQLPKWQQERFGEQDGEE